MAKNKQISGGSEISRAGGLTGATDTDYFYFFCPKCPDKQIMRILKYEVREETKENRYNSEFKKKAESGFIIAFTLFCEKCQHDDITKISNVGWQSGTYKDALGVSGA